MAPNSVQCALFIIFFASCLTRSSSQTDGTRACRCQETVCACCLRLRRFALNSDVCSTLMYSAEEPAISLLVSYNDREVIKRTLSAREPPPVCFSPFNDPFLNRVAKLCVAFYNVTYSSPGVSGCSELQATLVGQVITNYPLGCFSFNQPSTTTGSSLTTSDLIQEQKHEVGGAKGDQSDGL
ncbi:uncharacterized protein LOC135369485 [Ornithodoros turicata]|uniref:uncharacterized protein LOC135369485 n=1 Tax=Ornithodoros turicata TaxID=34597 RepID=UPI003139B21F